jgi:hypothetical protein
MFPKRKRQKICLPYNCFIMKKISTDDIVDELIDSLSHLWRDPRDQSRIAETIRVLNSQYDLNNKIAKEPGVNEIIEQMIGRLATSFGNIINIQNKQILDIACGSNTSKAPASVHINTPFGRMTLGTPSKGYTALFEPWFCRILLSMGASPVGVDFGDLESEAFTHYRVDLGIPGALDFLADHSFDAIQDSRLFGSPEFTAQFPHQADRLNVAQEIKRQELRILKRGGIIIHSDAAAMLR